MRSSATHGHGSIEQYARALRFELEQKDLSRIAALPDGELVLLLSLDDGQEKRVVIRVEKERVSVSEHTAQHYVPQAVVQCPLAHWIEYLQTGAIVAPDAFEMFGSLEVLETFCALHRLKQRPVSLRCQTMISGRRARAQVAHH